MARQSKPKKSAKSAKKKTRKTSGSTIAEVWMQIAEQRGMTAQPAAAQKSGAALWALLEDDLPPVRQAAGFALASVRDPSLVQAFILELRGATSARAATAALTLGEAGFTNAAPYFVAAFSRDDVKASAAFARALGLLADKAAAPVLIQALEQDFVPTEAAVALGQINDASALPALLKALSHAKDSVRAAAAYSLACLDAATPETEHVIHSRLTELGADASQRVRLCAAVARFERGDPEGLTAIKSALA